MSTSLDHIILLLPAKDFEKVPSWLSANFNIIEGGTHSRGTSHNKLIIFKDGTYLELFSWVDPQPKGTSPHADFPSWANKPEGYIIDWALTGSDAHANYEGIINRLDKLKQKTGGQTTDQLDMTYDTPSGGGRKRKDGKELQWMTTRPRLLSSKPTEDNDNAKARPRLDVPFFCHDVTDRKLRVQFDDASITTHPCGATGVESITVAVPDSQLKRYTELYAAILGNASDHGSSGADFQIDLPTDSSSSEGSGRKCVVHLRSEKDSDSFFEGSGIAIQGLSLVTDKQDLKGSKLDKTGLGAFVELC